MALPVNVARFVDEVEGISPEWYVYLNRQTGEFVGFTRDVANIVESGPVPDNLLDWEKEMARQAEDAMGSDDYLPLPSQFEIDEYDIMRRFARHYPVDSISYQLSNALHGSGAFRRFKDIVHRCGIADEWYEYRQAAFETIAIAWLEENSIPYTR